MGVVDLAVGPDGQPVAIKRLVLHGSLHEMAQARQRIRREAEALLQLDHPNVVRLLEVLDDGDDIVLVMPYFGGGTLADQIRAHGPLRPEQIRALAPPLMSALAAAHRRGVIHRDIKPANVLFDLDGRPYLADFGVASLRDATSGLTATGMLVGTPEFMAPEQARGERTTAASDVFSLGATIAFAATGEPPYGRGDPRVLVQRAAKGRVMSLPASIPVDIRRVLNPMLDKSPKRRPTAAAAVAATSGYGAAGTRLRVAAAPARRPVKGAAIGAALGVTMTLLALLAFGSWATGRADSTAAVSTAPTTTAKPIAPTTTVPCENQPYKPCGQPVAAFTDGVKCIEDHADYDGDATNGCEAAPDGLDGKALAGPVVANLVPGTDIDRYPFHVDDHPDLLCDGKVQVTLTAPKGATMHLDVLEGGVIRGSTTSANGRPGTVVLDEPNCWGDDAADLVARVTYSGDGRSAANYKLERSGSF